MITLDTTVTVAYITREHVVGQTRETEAAGGSPALFVLEDLCVTTSLKNVFSVTHWLAGVLSVVVCILVAVTCVKLTPTLTVNLGNGLLNRSYH